MGLEKLRKSLLDEAKTEAKKLLFESEKRASDTTQQATERAAKIRAQARENAKNTADAEMNERISSAQLKGKRLIAEAIDKKIQQALEKAWQEFSKLKESAEYEKMMKKFITSAEKELGANAVVHVNKSDEKIAKRFSKNVSQKPAQISGGAIVSTPDGRISIDNSLEAVFEQNREEAKKAIYSQMLKGGK